MPRPLSFTQEDLLKMIALRKQGYSNRKIAAMFNVPKTTVYQRVFAKKNTPQESKENHFSKIHIVVETIRYKKKQGLNSLETSTELDIPLKDVNHVWGNIRIH